AQVPVRLRVKTKEGCESATVEKIVHLLDQPEIELLPPISAACVGDEIILIANSTLSANPVVEWAWNSLIGSSTQNRITLRSTVNGDFPLSVRGKGANGCWSEPVQHIASFFQT
ncbi:hypothetical protein MD537_21180, partial [Flavihumibacter sediminis]|nr:hypothetical protein [Flavihumibacter sediminis]